MHDLSVVRYNKDITQLLTNMNAKRVCEIGVLRGRGLRRLNAPCVELIVGIDMWKPYGEDNDYDLKKCYKQAHQVKNDLGNVILIQADSGKAAKFFPDGFFDFVYIDANHFYQAVKNDIFMWWPKVRKGGVFAGHDYVDKSRFGDHFGVIQAVNEHAEMHHCKLQITKDKFSSWLTNKD